MTIQDLLRHTSGLTYGFFGDTLVKKAYVDAKVWMTTTRRMREFVDRLAKLPLAYQPGTTWDYSHSTDVLGRLVEVVSGKSLYQFEKERLLDPLGMTDTSFYVTDTAKQERIAEPFPNDRTIGAGAEFNDPRVAQEVGVGRRRHGRHRRGLCAFLPDAAQRRHARRQAHPRPARRVAYMTADHMGSAIAPGPYYLPGAGFGFGLGFAVRKDAGVSPVRRLGRRVQLGRRRRHLLLGRPEGEHVRRLHDAVAQAARAVSPGAAGA